MNNYKRIGNSKYFFDVYYKVGEKGKHTGKELNPAFFHKDSFKSKILGDYSRDPFNSFKLSESIHYNDYFKVFEYSVNFYVDFYVDTIEHIRWNCLLFATAEDKENIYYDRIYKYIEKVLDESEVTFDIELNKKTVEELQTKASTLSNQAYMLSSIIDDTYKR